ncbi:MAG: ABC transporter ATP-binding protein [Candidatus Odinarchaeia archaeon]
MVVIKVSDLTYNYEHIHALKKVTFTIKSGEIVGVIGSNGSGKTTLLKLLYRNLKPTKGSIKINDVDIKNLSNRELSSLQSVLPQNVLPVPMTVIELVLVGQLGPSPMPQVNTRELETAENALKKLGIAHLMDRNMLTLSGGEQKLAYIAMVIARDAQILLLDEPTAHLDYKHALKVMDAIKLEAEKGKAIIMAMHDLTMAVRYSNKLILLAEGAIIRQGSVEEVTKPDILRKAYGVNFEILRRKDRIEAITPISE